MFTLYLDNTVSRSSAFELSTEPWFRLAQLIIIILIVYFIVTYSITEVIAQTQSQSSRDVSTRVDIPRVPKGSGLPRALLGRSDIIYLLIL